MDLGVIILAAAVAGLTAGFGAAAVWAAIGWAWGRQKRTPGLLGFGLCLVLQADCRCCVAAFSGVCIVAIVHSPWSRDALEFGAREKPKRRSS